MSLSINLRYYLENQGKLYDILQHPRAVTSMRKAQAAHIAGDQVAKTLVIEDQEGYWLAVIPATHRLRFAKLREKVGHNVGLASEAEMQELFRDCEVGAIPPFGRPFGLKVLIDERLLNEEHVYCECGDHEELVHLSGDDFRDLMADAVVGDFSRHV
jgi:Ala-tRNA(Pro) deacylase